MTHPSQESEMREPTTEAGRELLDHFGPRPLPEAQELHRRSAQGRRDKLHVAICAIEEQAATEARRELLAKVEGLPVLRSEMFGEPGSYDISDLIDRAAVIALLEEPR